MKSENVNLNNELWPMPLRYSASICSVGAWMSMLISQHVFSGDFVHYCLKKPQSMFNSNSSIAACRCMACGACILAHSILWLLSALEMHIYEFDLIYMLIFMFVVASNST